MDEATSNETVNEQEGEAPLTGGTRSVKVGITLSGKPTADVFLTMEETYEFLDYPSADALAAKRTELAVSVYKQARDEIKELAQAHKAFTVANQPQGQTFTAPAAPAGANAGQQVANAPTPTNIQAAANGATVQGDWMEAPNKFGGEPVRFRTTAAYPIAQLEADALAKLAAMGYNPAAFKVWDDRPSGEQGQQLGRAARIAVAKEAESLLPNRIPNVANIKFNRDGGLWVGLSKEFKAAEQYGATEPLKTNPQAVPSSAVPAPAAPAAPQQAPVDENNPFI